RPRVVVPAAAGAPPARPPLPRARPGVRRRRPALAASRPEVAVKALVTGAAGFVGSSISAALLAAGWDVVGSDAMTDYYAPALQAENLARLGPDFRVVRAALADVDLPALLADADVVFHQAGQPGVRASWGQDFGAYLEANVAATQVLLEAARQAPNLARIVN